VWGLAGLAVLLLAIQLAVPPLAANRIEGRLTEDGGSADVSIGALPAVDLLLRGRGDRIEVDGEGIPVPLEGDADALDRLDDFGEVDIRLRDLRAGPVDTQLFTLERHGRDRPYSARIEATVVPSELARFAGSQFGPLGELLGGLAGGSIPLGDQAIPVMFDALVESDGGRVRVLESGGSLAGLPLGPLAQVIVSAVAGRL
jgi:hypothetical protein